MKKLLLVVLFLGSATSCQASQNYNSWKDKLIVGGLELGLLSVMVAPKVAFLSIPIYVQSKFIQNPLVKWGLTAAALGYVGYAYKAEQSKRSVVCAALLTAPTVATLHYGHLPVSLSGGLQVGGRSLSLGINTSISKLALAQNIGIAATGMAVNVFWNL